MNYSYTMIFVDKFSRIVQQLRLKLIAGLIGRDLKVISNITVTSDIIDYNKLYYDDCVLIGNKIKKVSDRCSFVYNPNNVTEVN